MPAERTSIRRPARLPAAGDRLPAGLHRLRVRGLHRAAQGVDRARPRGTRKCAACSARWGCPTSARSGSGLCPAAARAGRAGPGTTRLTAGADPGRADHRRRPGAAGGPADRTRGDRAYLGRGAVHPPDRGRRGPVRAGDRAGPRPGPLRRPGHGPDRPGGRAGLAGRRAGPGGERLGGPAPAGTATSAPTCGTTSNSPNHRWKTRTYCCAAGHPITSPPGRWRHDYGARGRPSRSRPRAGHVRRARRPGDAPLRPQPGLPVRRRAHGVRAVGRPGHRDRDRHREPVPGDLLRRVRHDGHVLADPVDAGQRARRRRHPGRAAGPRPPPCARSRSCRSPAAASPC